MSDTSPEGAPTKAAKAWVFQANPKIFRIKEALQHLSDFRWNIRQYRDVIKAGDRAFIWMTGPEGGCLARAVIRSDPAVMEEAPEELKYDTGVDKATSELRVELEITDRIDPPISRQELLDDPILKNTLFIRAAMGSNFPLTETDANALDELCSGRIVSDPLAIVFREFRANDLEALRVRLRRYRAAEIRHLLDSPEQISLEHFNQDIWQFETRTLVDGEDCTGRLFGTPTDEDIEGFKQALESGRLELHGNYVWRPGTRSYGAMLTEKTNAEKQDLVRSALGILVDSDQSPVEKATAIEQIPGFGFGTATGFVMLVHPNELAVWNRQSKEALEKLGMPAAQAAEFQTSIKALRERLGAKDYLELDWFLYLLNQGVISVPPLEKKPTGPAPPTTRFWAISLGEGGRLWNQCQEEKVIAIGWDELGDLRQYPDQNTIAAEIRARRGPDAPAPHNDSRACFEFVHKIAPGDFVVAKIGRSKMLGVGTVVSDYIYDPSRKEYHHVRRVNWLRAANLDLPEEAWVPTKTLTDVTDYKAFVEFVREYLPSDSTSTAPPSGEEAPIFTLDDAMEDLFLPRSLVESIVKAIHRKKNAILQGPPGVGKTYIALRLAYAVMGRKDGNRIDMVQFHQAYAYEDFIQGFRPQERGGFQRRDGRFYEFCNRARLDRDRPYVFIIDEINRGNLSKIFGELMMLIEHDKRGPGFAIPLTYSESSNERFSVPENVHLIGLMNTADRSLAMVDYALRRRFVFFRLEPQFASAAFRSHLQRQNTPAELIDRIISRMSELNDAICANKRDLGPGFAIGHSFFCPPAQLAESGDAGEWPRWYDDVIRTEIAPLLEEYWFDDVNKAKQSVDKLLNP
jgi:MoxR-like ATPase